MGVGLWLSSEAANELSEDDAGRERFSAFLRHAGLETFTFNGFPFGNFHQPVVKHAVYHPTWFDAERASYTHQLIELIQQFCELGKTSISTLPIAWGNPQPSEEELTTAARQLRELAADLVEIRDRTGRETFVCLEPEPGCYLQTADDVVRFFGDYLLRSGQPTTKGVAEADIRRHIRVCHDVCHSVVMCETQAEALDTYRRAGIQLGKVQISSAVWVDFDALESVEKKQAFQELNAFAEDRYLHQTTIQLPGQPPTFYEDLPQALETIEDAGNASGVWKTHFHVPVYLKRFGQLRASQQEILDFMSVCRDYSDVEHFEVETYAWNVLPHELQKPVLAEGIAEELLWFKGVAEEHLGAGEAALDE